MEYAILSKQSYEDKVEGFTPIFDKKTDTQCFLKKDGQVVTVLFRGTNSLTDWRYDFQILRKCTSYLGGSFVHIGFLKQYESVREQIHEFISDDVNHVICVGHSLASALSTICALDVKLNKNIEKVSYIGFGGPRVGGPRFVRLFNEHVDNSYRYVAYKDPITFTPFPLRFRHVKGGVKLSKDSLTMTEPNVFCFCGCMPRHHSCNTYIACLKGVTLNL